MIERHPYGEFIPRSPRCMIIGSFPIGKFTNPSRKKEIKPHEHDFFFGGEKNLLWKLIGHAFDRELVTKEQIVQLLETYGIAIGDVIHCCKRKKGSASDADLYEIQWNQQLLQVIDQNHIEVIYFTSRKVENWFERLFPESQHLEKINLISPSAQSLRSLGRNQEYLSWKEKYPQRAALDFLKDHYRKKFSWLLRK